MYSLFDFQFQSTTKSGGLMLRHNRIQKLVYVSKQLSRLFLQGLYNNSFSFIVVEELWTDKKTMISSPMLVAKIDYVKVVL
jgi:hypothetical protein